MHRRSFTRAAAAAALFTPILALAAAPVIEVFKTASCGCCMAWVEHLKANGFATRVKDVDDPSVYRKRGGITVEVQSRGARAEECAL